MSNKLTPGGEPTDVDLQRLIAYRRDSDPLFFKWKRDEATEQEWLDAVQTIKDEHPKL